MALNETQRGIINILLKEGDLSIKEISRHLGFSASYVRIQLDKMADAGELTVDKRRQPYTYDVAPESPEMRTRRDVERVKELLRGKAESNNKFIAAIKSGRKELWMDAVPTLRALAQAIEEMNADGELIDTLEV